MCYGYQTWSEESLMQVCDDDDDDDFHGGQRSSEDKCDEICAMAEFSQKNHSCKFKMIMTFMEVKGQKGSNIVSIVSSI